MIPQHFPFRTYLNTFFIFVTLDNCLYIDRGKMNVLFWKDANVHNLLHLYNRYLASFTNWLIEIASCFSVGVQRKLC